MINDKGLILVTGATGFIGSAVAAKLVKSGYRLALLIRSGSKLRYHQNELSQCMLIEYDKVGGIEKALCDLHLVAVLHLAGAMIKENGSDTIVNLLEGNFELGVHLLNVAVRNDCRCFITAGSYWQLGDVDGSGPICLYAELKRCFSDLLVSYGRRNYLSTATLILHDVYGEGDKRGKVLDILLRIAMGEPAPAMTNGTQVLDMVHVNDTAIAFEATMDRLYTGKAPVQEQWWVSGQRISLRGLAVILENLCGKKLDIPWGTLPFGPYAIMEPIVGPTLPGWEPKIKIEDWLKSNYNNTIEMGRKIN